MTSNFDVVVVARGTTRDATVYTEPLLVVAVTSHVERAGMWRHPLLSELAPMLDRWGEEIWKLSRAPLRRRNTRAQLWRSWP